MTAMAEAAADGPRQRFVADLRAAVDVWRAAPWLPTISVALVATIAVLTHLATPADGTLSTVANVVRLPVTLFSIGWMGTQWLVYPAVRHGRDVTAGQRWRLGWRYVLPFVLLAFSAAIITMPLLVPVVLVNVLAEGTSVATFISTIVLLFIVDAVFTFITPAYVFTTPDAFEAIRAGLEFLRTHWRAALWHVVVTPLVLFGVAWALFTAWPLVGTLALAAWALVALAVKGAIAVYFLRTTGLLYQPEEVPAEAVSASDDAARELEPDASEA